MRFAALACVLVACGRVGFDAPAPGDAVDAALPIDGPPPGCVFTAVPAYVQGRCDTNVNLGMAATFSVTFAAPVVAGHVLIVAVDWDGVALSATITDSLGNAFQTVNPIIRSTSQSGQIVYASVTVGGADTVTVAFQGGTASGIGLHLHEYSGISFSSTVDAFVGGTGSGIPMASGAVTTAVAGELLFAHGVSMDVVMTPGAGYTERQSCNQNMTEDQLAITPGSYDGTFTSKLARPWFAAVAAFRPATCP